MSRSKSQKCTRNTVQHLKQTMLLKRRNIIHSPAFQVNLHEMLNLCSGPSIMRLQRRYIESSTCEIGNSGNILSSVSALNSFVCIYLRTVTIQNKFIEISSKAVKGNYLLSMCPRTNPGCGPQFSCSLERNNTTAK